MMPFAGSETPVVDPSIDVEEALTKDLPASGEPAAAPAPALEADAPASDDSADAPAPDLAAEAPVSGEDSLTSDLAEPQQLTFGTSAESADAGNGEADDSAISLPLWQLQIVTGALLALLLAATLGLMMRRRRAL